MNAKEKLCLSLFEIGAVKFGLFTLKSGLKSPVYIDLRVLVSFPKVLEQVAVALKEISSGLSFDLVAGIPFTALSIATAFSLLTETPMIYPRKEVKDYGTKRKIEGVFSEGQTALVLDDLITTGESKFEAIAPLTEAGLKVKDVVVLVDREQGGKEQLKGKGFNLQAVLTITEVLEILKKQGKITEQQFNGISSYFKNPNKWQEGK